MNGVERGKLFNKAQRVGQDSYAKAYALDLSHQIVGDFYDNVTDVDANVGYSNELGRQPHWREAQIAEVIVGMMVTKQELVDSGDTTSQVGSDTFAKLEILAADMIISVVDGPFALKKPEVRKWIINGDRLAEEMLEARKAPYVNRYQEPHYIPVDR